MDKYDLKKRAYIGTTSMEAEVSLLMANQALAGPGKYVYDPFGASLFISLSPHESTDLDVEHAQQPGRARCSSRAPSLAP